MKITDNISGNYSLNKMQAHLRKKAPQPEDLNNEEKKFFIDKYPDSKEVVDYHFYQKSGKMQGVKIGNIFDRKG